MKTFMKSFGKSFLIICIICIAIIFLTPSNKYEVVEQVGTMIYLDRKGELVQFPDIKRFNKVGDSVRVLIDYDWIIKPLIVKE